MEDLEILHTVSKLKAPEQLQEKLKNRILQADAEEKSLRIILPLIIFAFVIIGVNLLVAKKDNPKQEASYQSNLNTQLYNE